MLDQAREAHAQHRWDDAYAGFRAATSAGGATPRDPSPTTAAPAGGDAALTGALDVEDLAAFADAAWWLGRTDESLAMSEEVFGRLAERGDLAAAARTAIEMGFLWVLRGEITVGSGWIARAGRMLAEVPECVEHGYLRYLETLDAMGAGRFDDAIDRSRAIQDLASRHDDATLTAIGFVFEGIALLREGHVERGLQVIDEAMLPVHAGQVRPNWAGNLYCNLIGLFFELADLRRARAWTGATERWCSHHSHAAMFAGICRVHRAQLLQVDGRWSDAELHAQQACDDLADMNLFVVAEGEYLRGEILRLRGDDEAAETHFERAAELGRDPQPGWALLRASQGQSASAAAGLRSALAGAVQPLQRPPLLAAQVEVAVGVGDVDVADTAARELDDIARCFPSPGLDAMAARSMAVTHCMRGDATPAIPLLRSACRTWRELDARYEAARARADLARALDLLGDGDTAAHEREMARAVFAELGAVRDIADLDRACGERPAAGGLTGREAEVLREVAEGRTNRQIAGLLGISERTVERHVSNIFTKLDVSSRTEAARVAFDLGVHLRR